MYRSLIGLLLFSFAAFGSAEQLSKQQLLEMKNEQIAENVIREYVEQNGIDFSTSPFVLVELKKKGFSDDFLEFLVGSAASSSGKSSKPTERSADVSSSESSHNGLARHSLVGTWKCAAVKYSTGTSNGMRSVTISLNLNRPTTDDEEHRQSAGSALIDVTTAYSSGASRRCEWDVPIYLATEESPPPPDYSRGWVGSFQLGSPRATERRKAWRLVSGSCETPPVTDSYPIAPLGAGGDDKFEAPSKLTLSFRRHEDSNFDVPCSRSARDVEPTESTADPHEDSSPFCALQNSVKPTTMFGSLSPMR